MQFNGPRQVVFSHISILVHWTVKHLQYLIIFTWFTCYAFFMFILALDTSLSTILRSLHGPRQFSLIHFSPLNRSHSKYAHYMVPGSSLFSILVHWTRFGLPKHDSYMPRWASGDHIQGKGKSQQEQEQPC